MSSACSLPALVEASSRRCRRAIALVAATASGPFAAIVAASSSGAVQRAALGGEPVDQADLGGPRRGQRLAGQQHLQRDANGTRRGSCSAAPPAATSERFTSGTPNRAVSRRDDEVAGQQQLEPAGQRPALDRADQRLARRRLGDPAQPAALDRRASRRAGTP